MNIKEFYEPSVLAKKVKRTKVITTIGPVTTKKDILEKLFEKGMNVIRLNFSHGDQKEQGERIANAMAIRNELNRPISILLDTKGPEIRIGKMIEGKQTVVAGSEITIFTSEEEYKTRDCKPNEMTSSYDMSLDLKTGDLILVDDGKLELTVLNVEPGRILAKAFNTHDVKTNKRVNLPGIDFSMPFMSEKDRNDIIFATKNPIDYIAASFVNTKENVQEIREILKENDGENIQIISKIESQVAIENIDEIIAASDGIMVARGDLGLEIPYYEVPYWEKQIIRKCRKAGKIVIVATQMLETMTESPAPTRAEVTDVYYATELGADATMLSGETASGLYPDITVETMSTINKRAELAFYGKIYYDKALESAKECTKGERADIALDLATRTRDGGIEYAIVFSRTGELLKTISKFRPNVTILGVSEDERLWTAFGAWHSIYMNKVTSINDTKGDDNALSSIAKTWGAKSGEKILIVDNVNVKEFIIK